VVELEPLRLTKALPRAPRVRAAPHVAQRPRAGPRQGYVPRRRGVSRPDRDFGARSGRSVELARPRNTRDAAPTGRARPSWRRAVTCGDGSTRRPSMTN
jgi:hypothetical protein